MSTTTTPLALGLDVGGTSTRALVVDLDGTRHGAGKAAGANITSHAPDRALDAISTALRGALGGIDPRRVHSAVIGTAGDRHLQVPAVAHGLAERWRAVGLHCEYEITPDATVAFVAGTAAPDGTLVLSGTGSLTARFDDRQLVHRAGGHGWLLSDLGSGFWLGREAVRVALVALDRRTAPGPLGHAVIRTLLGTVAPGTNPREVAGSLVLRIHGKPPIALAELAPLVNQHAGHDAEADRILSEAAQHLMRETSMVRPPGRTTPIVLAGSLLSTETSLAELLRARLVSMWPGAPIRVASDAAAGAAWLAAIRGLPDAVDAGVATVLHHRLFGG